MKKLAILVTALFNLTVISYCQDSITVKVLVGTSTNLDSYAAKATTDSMRTNIYSALNGKQAAGSYALAATTDSMRTNVYAGLNGRATTATTDSMRTNIYGALNGKQAAGNYVTLAGSEVVTGKTFGAFNFAVDAQSNDSYVVSLSPAPAGYTTGMVVIFKANTANTTGCSINVNGLGSKTIVKRVNTTLATGDILAGMFCYLVYDGTNFVIMNPVVN
jgi:hypothetical protein